MKRKYVVRAVEGWAGIELMADPLPRRIYGPGDVVELDDSVHDVAGLMGRGLLGPPVEEAPASKGMVAHNEPDKEVDEDG